MVACSSSAFDQINALRPRSILDVVPREVFIELGQPGYEHIGNGNCFEWKYAIAKWLQPKSILEIGVRYGYSLCSFLCAGPLSRITGIDNGSYKSDWSSVTQRALKLCPRYDQFQWISCDATTLEAFSPHDLTHIDGPHTYDATLNLLRKARSHAILVDDTLTCPDDMRAVRQFCQEQSARVRELIHIPSHVGESLILLQ